MYINIISAMCKNNGIGIMNQLPWHYKCDLQFFSKVTRNNYFLHKKQAVIMGRNTWNSLPKPLPHRSNYIISKSTSGENVFSSIDDCLQHCRENNYSSSWIIGGQSIYDQTIHRKDIDFLYLTHIHKEYECDTFFPEIPDYFKTITSSYRIENDTLLFFSVMKNYMSK